MRFASPETLWLLLLVPALVVLWAAGEAAARRRLRRFASPQMLARITLGSSRGRRILVAALRAGAVALAILALARPQWGRRDEPVVRRGVDVVLAIDLSASMLAEDVRPSRLEQARAQAVSLLESLGGDRVALVAFGGRAAVQCPLTLDYGAVRLFLDAAEVDFSPGPGTDLGRAIAEASKLFSASERRYKAVVLLTDGEDLEERAGEAARRARDEGVVIHAIGVGTRLGGPIPLREENGQIVGYKKDRQGRVVTTRLDPSALEAITELTGGTLLLGGPAREEGRKIAEAIASMEKKEISSRLATRYEDRFQIPLAVSVGMLFLASVIPARRGAARFLAACVLLLALPVAASDPPGAGPTAAAPGGAASSKGPGERPGATTGEHGPASASPREEGEAPAGAARGNRAGNKAYSAEDYPEALARYEEASAAAPRLPSVRYNIGNALYRQGKYDAAASEYLRALSGAGKALAPAVRFNLGNTLYQQGQYREAAEAFRDLVVADPGDEAARKNLELALRRLREQQKPPPQTSSQNDKESEQDRQQQQSSRPGDEQQPRNKDQRPDGSQSQEGEKQSERGDQDRNGSMRGGEKGAAPDTLDRREAERLLDSLAREEGRELKRRMGRRPREDGPEKDW